MAVALSACGTASVSRSGSTARAPARASGCTVEFLQHPPQRKYENLGTMYSYWSRVIDVKNALRPKACELGADAVIVTQDSVVVGGRTGREGKLVAGTAIRYVDATGLAPSPRVMSAQEAVDIATHYARTHGLVIDYTRDALLDAHGRWHVALGGAGGRDSAFVLLDGYSGQVITGRVNRASGEYRPQRVPPGAPSEGSASEAPLPPTSEPPPPSSSGNSPFELPGPPSLPEAAPEPPAAPGPTPTD